MNFQFDLHSIRLLRTLAIAALVIVVMAIAAEVLQPLALAILLCFILGPVVRWFERARLPRFAAVLLSMTLALLVVGGIAYVVGTQFAALVARLPAYESNILAKVNAFKPNSESTITKLETVATHVNETLSPTDEEATPSVRVVQDVPLLERIQTVLGPFQEAGALTGIVLLLVFFLLLQRDDVQDRIVQLVGRWQISLTTRTVRQISERLSRYLATFALFNTCYGFFLGVGLWLIGLPYAVLWGVLGGILRFIPYLGPLIAFVLPTVFSIAHFPTWREPVFVLLLYGGAELIANSVEPYVYGRSTGVSSLGLLVSALFWTWLWGGLGLLMAAPLTVCLVVLGQHIRDLHFLSTLLSERIEVDDDLRWYQRILNRDFDGAMALLEEAVGNRSPGQVFDEIVVPALSRADQDLAAGYLERRDAAFLREVVEEWLEDLAEAGLGRLPARPANAEETVEPERRLVGIVAENTLEDLILRMVNLLLAPTGQHLTIIPSSGSSLTMSDKIAEIDPDLILVSHLPPNGLTRTRYLIKRLRSRFPNIPMVVGYWDTHADSAAIAEQLRSVLAHRFGLGVLDVQHDILEELGHENGTAGLGATPDSVEPTPAVGTACA